jgi:hypothetical protein
VDTIVAARLHCEKNYGSFAALARVAIQPHTSPIEHPKEKEMRPRALGAIGSILALIPACGLAANPLGPGQLFWILGANAYNAMLNTSISGTPDAVTLLDGYFNTTSTYVIVYNEDPSGNGVIKQSPYYNEVRQRLPRANLVLDVINETTLELYLNSGSVDPYVGAIMYDDEGGATWGTSSTEKAHPGYYIPRAKAAINSYNAKYGTHLILLSVPASDLYNVVTEPPKYTGGATRYDDFLNEGIPAVAAQQAAIYEIQSQKAIEDGGQPLYQMVTSCAAGQAHLASSGSVTLGGLSTYIVSTGYQSGHTALFEAVKNTALAPQNVTCANANDWTAVNWQNYPPPNDWSALTPAILTAIVPAAVSGYWLNIPQNRGADQALYLLQDLYNYVGD